MEYHFRFITVGLTSSTYRLCRYTWLGWIGLRVLSRWFLLDLQTVYVDTLIGLYNHHRFITVVLAWATYCRVDTPIGLENHQSFIIVVITWSTFCGVDTPIRLKNLQSRVSSQWFLLDLHTVCVCSLIGLENHQSFIPVVLTRSTHCLSWYTDWVGEPSGFHPSGSYLIYILSCSYTDWVGEPSEFHHSCFYLIYVLLCWYTDWVGDQSPFHNNGYYLVLTWSTCRLCWYTDWVGKPSPCHNSGSDLIYILSVLIYWLGWKTITMS